MLLLFLAAIGNSLPQQVAAIATARVATTHAIGAQKSAHLARGGGGEIESGEDGEKRNRESPTW